MEVVMKKIFALFVLSFALVLASCGRRGEVSIVYTNDVHSYITKDLSYGNVAALKQDLLAQGKNVALVDAGDFMIERVGLCSGAGAEFILNAQFHGAQAFVTGDVKYHEAQAAVENKIHVVDAGHFATEFPIVHELAEYLRDELKIFDVKIFEDDEPKDFFQNV